jgi:23S rRNA pseudouridine1911/1915/1917 synthase
LTAGQGLNGQVYRLQVPPEQRGQRLDVFLKATLGPDISRSRLQHLIEAGRVEVKGKTAKAALKLTGNEEIIVQVPPPEPLEVIAENWPLSVVYEDDYLLVIDKPAGVVVHPAPGHRQGTLVNALLAHCDGQLPGIGGMLRPGIVHRLDKDTSGLLVVAKNEAAHHGLTAALKARTVRRRYLCLVHDRIKPDQGTIDAPIGRHPKLRFKMAVVPDGRPARTHFTVLERLESYTYLKVTLETGRTHQIRVHLAFIGHPVVGDPLYGRRQGNLGLKRQFLHAAELGFVHPITGEKLEFASPLPEELSRALGVLKRNHQ